MTALVLSTTATSPPAATSGWTLEALFAAHRQHVYACAFKYCGGRADVAEDVVSTVFMKARDFLPKFDGGMDARGWLYRVAKNVAISQMKSEAAWHRRTLAFLSSRSHDVPAPTQAMADRQLAALAWQKLRQMPARERMVAVMHFLDDESQTSIASKLGISEASVSRALAKIRTTLAKDGWHVDGS